MDSRLQNIATRWDKVEYRIKEIELLSREVRIPAINELRYAGRQLVDALIAVRNNNLTTDIVEQKIRDHVVVAEQYIRNSDHDVSDATIDFIRNRLDKASRIYGRRSIHNRFNYFGEMQDRLTESERLIKQARKDRTIRDKNYDEIYNTHISRLLPLFDQFRRVEPEIIYDSLVIERKYKISKVFNVVAGIASIIGVGLAVVSWTVPWSDVKALTCGKVKVFCDQPQKQ